MILDSSAVIAILRAEPEAPAMVRALDRAEACGISAVSYVEAAIVIDSSRDPIASRRFDDFFREAEIVIESVTLRQAEIARQAYRDFGKGRHRAGLNFGDCFAYALAKEKGETLLFKGDDFCQTDIEAAEDLGGLGGIRDGYRSLSG
ncbi:MAG TPA: type II toxin-antitoxin system VapC family toxin [Candidatus Eremiobacteraceae bacterium]|nr:type II toxin-antitoxin system VapC family toxin [Candidatus Eremiobacteraceae bacterium]